MTIQEKISKLDKAIIMLRSMRNDFAASHFMEWSKEIREMFQITKDALNEVGAEEALIKQVYRVAFGRSGHSMWGGSMMENNSAYIESCEAGVDALISILNDYRRTLKESIAHKVQMWTLVFSIIAAVGTVLSLIF